MFADVIAEAVDETAEQTVEKRPRKTPEEIEIERLAALAPADLNTEDLRVLRRLRDTRASLLECEAELEEVKERRKLRKETLNEALLQATVHFERRQMALDFGSNV